MEKKQSPRANNPRRPWSLVLGKALVLNGCFWGLAASLGVGIYVLTPHFLSATTRARILVKKRERYFVRGRTTGGGHHAVRYYYKYRYEVDGKTYTGEGTTARDEEGPKHFIKIRYEPSHPEKSSPLDRSFAHYLVLFLLLFPMFFFAWCWGKSVRGLLSGRAERIGEG